MKISNILICLFLACISCKQDTQKIKIDTISIQGTSESVHEILNLVEAKLKSINSISANASLDMTSEMYGDEQVYSGKIVAKYNNKTQKLEDQWFETKQNKKGKTSHIKGVLTSNGLKELHILKKKVITGNKKARSEALITYALGMVYGGDYFFKMLRNTLPKGQGGPLNVSLEKIEVINTVECYVIKTQQPDDLTRATRYYISVKDALYYGRSVEVNGEDGQQVSKFLFANIEINTPLPVFDVDVPEEFLVERYVSRRDIKDLVVGDIAVDWTLLDDKGNEQTLSKYEDKLILMDFWATWCGPCKAKMPHIQKLHEKYKNKGLRVVSVLSSDTGHEKQAVKYLKKHKYTFDLVFGTNELSDQYRIQSLPTVIAVNREGEIVYFRNRPGINDGVDSKVELEDFVDNFLKNK